MFDKVYITEARSKDYDEIVNFSKGLFYLSPYQVDKKIVEIVGEDRIHEIVYSILENSSSTFILVLGGIIIGFLAWSFERNISRVISRNYYRINLFGVRKDFQNKGFGKTLLEYFLNYVRKHKSDIVEVNTDANNQVAFGIYSSFGFNYSSSFLTFRLFRKKSEVRISDLNSACEPLEVRKVLGANEINDFEVLRIKNEEYNFYPVTLFYDRTIEGKSKMDLFDSILRSFEEKRGFIDIFVGYLGSKPVGYVVVKEDLSLVTTFSRISSNKDICVYRVLDLFVDKGYRERGIGKSLLSSAILEFSKEYNFVETMIPSHNYAMASVLTSLGFRLSHTMVNFIKNKW